MHQLPEARKIIENTLNQYKYDFHCLIKSHADYWVSRNGKSCDFFVDIGSLMNGTWGIYAEIDIEGLSEFKEFDWYEILLIDEKNNSEELYIPILNEAYKIGYLWIEEQLIALKLEIQSIEVRLYHNGSSEYQALT